MKTNQTEEICDQSRRKLLKKAYVAPVVVALGTMVLVSPSEAVSKKGGDTAGKYAGGYQGNPQADSSDYRRDRYGSSSLHQDNGWGNGDDSAPGESGPHNNAENDIDGRTHRNHGDSHYN